MGTGKEMVVTAYGHDNVIDKIAVSSFDDSSGKNWQYEIKSDAHTYCKMLNNIELMGDSWIFARIVPETTPVTLSLFFPLRFSDLIKKITGRSLQMVFRELNDRELAAAFKGCDKAVLDKISGNMPTGAYQILKDNMESMEPVKKKDTIDSRDKMISIIRHLQDTGVITIDLSGEDAS
jgi:flagellar motor switch protein FliG